MNDDVPEQLRSLVRLDGDTLHLSSADRTPSWIPIAGSAGVFVLAGLGLAWIDVRLGAAVAMGGLGMAAVLLANAQPGIKITRGSSRVVINGKSQRVAGPVRIGGEPGRAQRLAVGELKLMVLDDQPASTVTWLANELVERLGVTLNDQRDLAAFAHWDTDPVFRLGLEQQRCEDAFPGVFDRVPREPHFEPVEAGKRYKLGSLEVHLDDLEINGVELDTIRAQGVLVRGESVELLVLVGARRLTVVTVPRSNQAVRELLFIDAALKQARFPQAEETPAEPVVGLSLVRE